MNKTSRCRSTIEASGYPLDTFETIQLYCMFVGYPRSGHSLVGAMFDAHPDIVIAHELDALRYLKAGVWQIPAAQSPAAPVRTLREAG